MAFLKSARAGFSTAEFLVAAVVAGIVLGGVGSFFLKNNKARAELEQMSVLDDIALNLRRSLLNRDDLLATLGRLSDSTNDAFRLCVQGGPPGSVCVSDELYPFRLYTAGNTRPLSGPEGLTDDAASDPIYYNLQGSLCAGASPSCPIQVTTLFRAFCRSTQDGAKTPLPALSCPNVDDPYPPTSGGYVGQGNADLVEIIFTVRSTRPDLVSSLGSEVQSSVILDVREILAEP